MTINIKRWLLAALGMTAALLVPATASASPVNSVPPPAPGTSVYYQLGYNTAVSNGTRASNQQVAMGYSRNDVDITDNITTTCTFTVAQLRVQSYSPDVAAGCVDGMHALIAAGYGY